MSETVTVTTTVIGDPNVYNTEIVMNAGYLKSGGGLLKILELVIWRQDIQCKSIDSIDEADENLEIF